MSQQLKYIAQAAEDMYYGELRSQSDFFTFDDFVRYCGYAVMDILLQEYRVRRSENRSEKKEEVIPFSADWEIEEVIEVKKTKEGAFIGELPFQLLSFPFDRQSSALQEVTAVKPRGLIYERSNVEENWMQRYAPPTERVFWTVIPQKEEKSQVEFFSRGKGIEQVKIRFIPQPTEDMLVPNGIENYVITSTVSNMRQIEAGVVIDKTNDGNPNKVVQSEINKRTV